MLEQQVSTNIHVMGYYQHFGVTIRPGTAFADFDVHDMKTQDGVHPMHWIVILSLSTMHSYCYTTLILFTS